ncbi:D-alanine--D-alanine ligase A [Saccharomonospora piscinae]|uniref:D-alanine--D-alanine ligase n=1 Tax=Saccharomonospora piscinae TaxID=687388 RepID=A0A1V8ZYM6_SACPI|nr:D-alanine--D-alanine ligase family protein [Saccharomonospora piscinae]OQO90029.1 D-alanine--D-alanine ligase A [Saccharomonospora piscinae]TLW90858.1 D-alanine--D-alanine ligase [Saccharomonospora piscinae]
MSSRKTRVAVVFGGRSTEHTISCVSAGSILANLDPDRFEIVPIGITRAGGWVLGTNDPDGLRIRDRELPTVTDGRALVLAGDPTTGGVVTLEEGQRAELLSAVDVVFPVLHGAFGEDGTIQGLLEMADLPYVGAGVFASAAAMDKEYAKKLLAAEGLEVGRYAVVRRGQETLPAEERERLGLPVFVKPARAGSSIGISRVTDWSQLEDALALARRTDPKVLIEAETVGREVECGVLEFPDGRVEASLPSEIRVCSDDADAWYDFETKYLGEDAELDIPAKLDDTVTEGLRAAAVRAFAALDCQGLARVDFFVGADGTLTVNEVNTMPGFTSTSAYPKMWAVTGVDYPTLLTTLVETALARGTGLR